MTETNDRKSMTEEERENWKAFFSSLGFVTEDANGFKKFTLLHEHQTIATDHTTIIKKNGKH